MQDGVINIFKPKGCTSHDIVYKIKKITNKKVGHTGTLDPLAQGVLPILVGKGTLCSKYLMNHDKTYKVKLKLGKRTATSDLEGEVLEERELPINLLKEHNIEHIKNVLNTFKGNQQQKPPLYSAIKVNGKKLYEYARKGQEVDIKPRNITIYDIELLGIDEKKQSINFEVSCSKGTYIRSLCEDIAKALNTIGYMEDLLRVQVGEFSINNSISLQTIDKNGDELEKAGQTDYENIEKNIITIEQVFKYFSQIELDKKQIYHFLNGVKITLKVPDGVYRVYNQSSEFIGTGVVEKNLIKRDIIL